MFKRTVILTMACCLSAPLFAGCADDTGGIPTGSACKEGCPDGEHCDEEAGKCVKDSSDKKDCEKECKSGMHCDTKIGECVKDSDTPSKKCPAECDEGYHCSQSTDYECVKDMPAEPVCDEECSPGTHCDEFFGECIDDEIVEKECAQECGEGSHCDTSIGKCKVDVTCKEDCPEGTYCDLTDGLCMVNEIEDACDGQCTQGMHCNEATGQCEEDAVAEKECTEECGSHKHCDKTVGQCVFDEKECETDQRLCSGSLLMKCSSDGFYEFEQDCAENEEAPKACYDNGESGLGCYVSECELGDTKCDGAKILACNEFHKFAEDSDCADNADKIACESVDGVATCVSKCDSGTSRCVDNQVEICSDVTGKYEVSGNCPLDEGICRVDSEDRAQCIKFDCKDGEMRCKNDVVEKCNSGFYEASSDCAAIGYVCKEEGGASCIALECTGNESKCVDKMVYKCNNGFYDKTDCSVAFKDSGNDGKCVVSVESGASCKAIKTLDDGYDPENDQDKDTIMDDIESCSNDQDKDGKVDCKDPDSDGDTIPDKLEADNAGGNAEPGDADFDGTPNYLDPDSDGNGIPDSVECCGKDAKCLAAKDSDGFFTYCIDTDGDTVPDFLDYDNDGDGFDDVKEIKGMVINPPEPEAGKFSGYGCKNGNAFGTADKPVDCDADTIPDYMDFDSDNDGLCDDTEGVYRINVNGNDGKQHGSYARYNPDTDGDTISDAIEALGVGTAVKLPTKDARGCYSVSRMQDSDGDGIIDLLEIDSDNDGIKDIDEQKIVCSNGLVPRLSENTDGDAYLDAAEKAVAEASGGKFTVAQLVCDKAKGVKDVYNFYFELPDNKRSNDALTFTPKVTKLDLVFNVDTTGSMMGTINSVKKNISSILTSVQSMVSDSGFALTNFDDFPNVKARDNNWFSFTWGTAGSGSDLPFRVLGYITTVKTTAASYPQNELFTTRSGSDVPESGTESLYQIATGAGVSYMSGSASASIPKRVNPSGRWGGVDFRNNSLPVVIHVSDTYSHDVSSTYGTTQDDTLVNYQVCSGDTKSKCVYSPHYTKDLVPVLKNKGVRVISLDVGNGDKYSQMTVWSRESNAVVPVCAFKTASNTWNCNGTTTANKCCLGTDVSDPLSVNGKANQCILKYTGAQDAVNQYIVKGVDALVKYGTYDVTTKIRGNVILANGKNTSCFIDKVTATSYIRPPQEPEYSCNPAATITKFNNSTYYNGFKNFATGTSNSNKEGAKLKFTVYVKNDGCYVQDDKTHVFEAYIDVYNPTTGLVFDTQKVSIIVPAKIEDNSGEIGSNT